ncbi:M56 family metallopeptidase [Aminipila sp.]|uniref:M56 family metallopeptidase n=1 Tax=Aminipila sp. TaxID=2060095 RepID=UPI0028A0D0D3|nr:M56 family metallopeptidase [Aminipila sp.]
MEQLFLSVIDMSLMGSYAILFIIFIRFPLKKAPKGISYSLWSVAAVRLMCPYALECMFSLFPAKALSGSEALLFQQEPQSYRAFDMVHNFGTETAVVSPSGGLNLLQSYTKAGAYLWLLGVAVMLIYSIASVWILKRQLKSAENIQYNIYVADNLKTPFVLGILNPKIYLPAGLTEEEKSYIILHEQIHIRRLDPAIKSFGFIILSVHWFNPLVWIAFWLMSTDMELSCDEKVINIIGRDLKKAYSYSLLSLASHRHILNGNPLAFGEGNVKHRIKNVLNYTKPEFWVIAIALVAALVIGAGLLLNPVQKEKLEPMAANWSSEQSLGADMAVLDYASEDKVIFHGYFGLYVYDLEQLNIIRSLDLQAIGCGATQGVDYCEVSVSMDGDIVQLHPMSSQSMYIYRVSANQLIKTSYKPMKNSFLSKMVSVEEAVSEERGNYAYDAVKFAAGEYGVLYTSDWTLSTLTYIRGKDMLYALFDSKK